MKKNLFTAALVVVFSLAAMAADGAKLTASLAGNASASRSTAPVWGLPSVPSAILFYGGDINVSDPNAQGFANGNNGVTGVEGQTYGAVIAPTTHNVVVGGTFGNNATFFGTFDPAQGTYDVRTGISEGNGGTSIASGTATQIAQATGRSPFGLLEYSTFVHFAKPITSSPGTTYWVNENPQCTNSGDSNCASGEFYYLDNTTQETNNVNGYAQPPGEIFFNSGYFGFTWANWCDSALGQNSQQCARVSFGLTH